MQLRTNQLKLTPDVYYIALDSVGQTKLAIEKLKDDVKKYQLHGQLIELGLSFSRKQKDLQAFNYFSSLR